MLNKEMVGLMAIENATSEVEIYKEFNLEGSEFEMVVDLAIDEPFENKSVENISNSLSQMEVNEKLANERLVVIQKIIDDRRNGMVPEFCMSNTDEAKVKQEEDRKATLTELQDAQDAVDQTSTQ
jgi:hypothetical protein